MSAAHLKPGTHPQGSWRASPVKRAAMRLLDAFAPLCAWTFPRAGSGRETPARITVLALWGIGDAVLLTPLLRALRKRYPGSEIELVGQPFLRDLFRHDPSVALVTEFAAPWAAHTGKYRVFSSEYRRALAFVAGRRRRSGDWILTTRGDIREHVLAAAMNGGRRFGHADGGGVALLTDRFASPSPRNGHVHVLEGARGIARELGLPDGGSPELVLLAEERARAREALRAQGWDGRRPVLGLHLGAGSPLRKWPADRFREVIEATSAEVPWRVLIGDPEERWRAVSERIAPGGIMAGSLRDVMAILSQCDILLCHDSGLMHIAAALGVRVVALFGPGSLTMFAPCGGEHRPVFVADVPCRPCFDKCSQESAWCMDRISVEQVVGALRETLPDARNQAGDV